MTRNNEIGELQNFLTAFLKFFRVRSIDIIFRIIFFPKDIAANGNDTFLCFYEKSQAVVIMAWSFNDFNILCEIFFPVLNSSAIPDAKVFQCLGIGKHSDISIVINVRMSYKNIIDVVYCQPFFF